MNTHEFEMNSEKFESIINHSRKCIITTNFNYYKVGDRLLIREVLCENEYTGKWCLVTITHIEDEHPALSLDFVALSISFPLGG